MNNQMPEWMQKHAKQLGVKLTHQESCQETHQESWFSRLFNWFTGFNQNPNDSYVGQDYQYRANRKLADTDKL